MRRRATYQIKTVVMRFVAPSGGPTSGLGIDPLGISPLGGGGGTGSNAAPPRPVVANQTALIRANFL